MAKRKWYVVTVGKETGIYTNWLDVAPLVVNVPSAQHQSFTDEEEARTLYTKLLRKGYAKTVRSSSSIASTTTTSSGPSLNVPSAAESRRSSLPTPHPSPTIRSRDEFMNEETFFERNRGAGDAANGSPSQNPNATTMSPFAPENNEQTSTSPPQRAAPLVAKAYSISSSLSSPVTGLTCELDSEGRRPKKKDVVGSPSAHRITKSTSLFSASSLSSPATGITYKVDERGHQHAVPGSSDGTTRAGSRPVPLFEQEITLPPLNALSPLMTPNLYPSLSSFPTFVDSNQTPKLSTTEFRSFSFVKARTPRTITPPPETQRRRRGQPYSTQTTPATSPAMSERTVPLRSSAGDALKTDSESERSAGQNYRYSKSTDSNSSTESDDDPVIRVSPIMNTSTMNSYKSTTHQSTITKNGNIREIITVIHTETTCHPCHRNVCSSCSNPLGYRATRVSRSVGSRTVRFDRRLRDNGTAVRTPNEYEVSSISSGLGSVHSTPRDDTSGFDPRSPYGSKTINVGGLLGTQFQPLGRPSPLEAGMSSLLIQ